MGSFLLRGQGFLFFHRNILDLFFDGLARWHLLRSIIFYGGIYKATEGKETLSTRLSPVGFFCKD